MIIDAHQHFWQLGAFDYSWLESSEIAPIRRDFMPADLQPQMRGVGVDKCIFVQTQHCVAETEWALELADQSKFIAGVVGWVDLASQQCEAQLSRLKQHPKFVGVRHITQDEPDDDFIVRPDVIRGLRTLEQHQVPFDLLFYVKHLHHAATLAEQLPNLPMVIDHLAKPHIRDGRMDDWLPEFQSAARYPNIFCKLSGMITEADWQSWTARDLQPYVEAALEAFGPERLMFGSDWPVCELAGSYSGVLAALDQTLGSISEGDRQMIFGETAKQFYRLPITETDVPRG